MAAAIADVARHPQRLQVPRRHDVLGAGDGEIAVDHLEGLGIDDVDLAGDEVGRVDAVQRAGGRRADVVGGDRGVDVLRVDLRRHVQVGRRQMEGRRLRPEVVARLLDEIVRRPSGLDMGAAERGAKFAVDAHARDGEGLRVVDQRIRSDEDGESRGRGAGEKARIHVPSRSRRARGPQAFPG